MVNAPPDRVEGAQNWQHIGVAVGGEFRQVFYRGSAAYQLGTFNQAVSIDEKLNATMLDALVGYAIRDFMVLRCLSGSTLIQETKAQLIVKAPTRLFIITAISMLA